MDAAPDKYQRLALRGAWRRFEISGGGRTGNLENRLRALEEKVGDLNLERDAVHLAAELAALEPNLDDDARFGLIVLTIVTLAALAQGSTRFPVTGEISREPMQHMLGALVGSDASASENVRRSITSSNARSMRAASKGSARLRHAVILSTSRRSSARDLA